MAFIKIDRKFADWKWKSKPNMVAMWLNLLLQANYEDNYWNDVYVPRGCLITSIKKLSEQTGLTIQQTKTCISNLQITNEITIKTTNKYSLITIVNWDKYQGGAKKQQANQQAHYSETNKQITSKVTTLKEVKEIKNKEYLNNISIESDKNKIFKHTYGTYKNVLLSDEDIEKLKAEIPSYEAYIEKVSEYCAIKGKRYSNYLATIRNWYRRDNEQASDPDDILPTYDSSMNKKLSDEELQSLLNLRGKA